MRRSLETVAFLVLAWLIWMTYTALTGPGSLPSRIPTHFDAAGNANGWGPPSVLLLLPGVVTGVYLLLTVVSRFPSSFHYSVRVTEENRERLQTLSLDFLAWIKLELLILFALLQKQILEAVRQGRAHISAWLVPAFLVVLFGTAGWFVIGMIRAGREGTGGNGTAVPPGPASGPAGIE